MLAPQREQRHRPAMDYARQVGAIPFRRKADGTLDVMLVTSRQTRRWVIPKGWPWPDRQDTYAAAEEAWEEAGVLGRPGLECQGTYTYEKRRRHDSIPVRVSVYLLEVTDEIAQWPESQQRARAWFSLSEAALLVQEPELREIFERLDKETSGSSAVA
jgi:8-oxo-dGTP pyrophosphatase MutT (NUDIX family)